jgi:hypothetical protein
MSLLSLLYETPHHVFTGTWKPAGRQGGFARRTHNLGRRLRTTYKTPPLPDFLLSPTSTTQH